MGKSSPITDLWGNGSSLNASGTSSKLQSNWNENSVGVIGTNNSNNNNSILNDPALKNNNSNSGLLSSLSNPTSGISTSGISTATTNSSGILNASTNRNPNDDCVTKFVEYMKSKYNMKVIRSFP